MHFVKIQILILRRFIRVLIMKKTILLSIAILGISAIYGQRNFQPGYIVRNSGDTVRGLIDYKGWEKNPSRIVFKEASTSSEHTYTKSDISEFVIDGMDKYVRANVSMDMNPVTTQVLTGILNTKDSILMDTVFLRVLVDGDLVDLFEFVNNKPHYFIRYNAEEPFELGYSVSYNEGTGSLVSADIYRQQLKSILEILNIDSEEKTNEIDNLRYDASSLSKFVKRLNNGGSVVKAGQDKKKRKIVTFFAGGGIVISQLSFSGSDEFVNSLRFKESASYVITAGADFNLSRYVERIFIRTEISYSTLTAEGVGTLDGGGGIGVTHYENSYSLSMSSITPSVSFNAHFVSSPTVKLYAGAGMGYNFSSYSKHVLTRKSYPSGYESQKEDFPNLVNSWTALYLRLGGILFNRFEAGIDAQVFGSFVENLFTKCKSNTIFFKFCYRF
jgi:hypothetical protein